MRSKGIRYSALLLGILVAAAIILSHTYESALLKAKHNVEKTTEDNSDEQELTIITSISLPTSSVVQFSHDVFFLFEIIFDNNPSPDFDDIERIHVNRFFSTLLSIIISPNAP